MLCVVRLGLYPGGYLRYRMRSATNSRDEPAIGGPLLPARLGSRLWQVMQVVTYAIRPLSADAWYGPRIGQIRRFQAAWRIGESRPRPSASLLLLFSSCPPVWFGCLHGYTEQEPCPRKARARLEGFGRLGFPNIQFLKVCHFILQSVTILLAVARVLRAAPPGTASPLYTAGKAHRSQRDLTPVPTNNPVWTVI